jgi:RNA polymerase sigma factor (sigma-70 family)
MPTIELDHLPSEADAASFQSVRPRLFGIAYRVLGSAADADDVVQDAWIRWQSTDRTRVRDAPAFLATTTTRLAINARQSAHRRRETAITPEHVEAVDAAGDDPAVRAERSEALGRAMDVLERLSPTERAVYLMRAAFDEPYRQIAESLGLSEVNTRQIFARARRHLADVPVTA